MPLPRPDSTPRTKRPERLVPTTAEHGGTCGGERVACPIHGLPLGPLYRPAERQVRGGIVLIFAHDCRQAWRVAA
jgi:hypothetical protein